MSDFNWDDEWDDEEEYSEEAIEEWSKDVPSSQTDDTIIERPIQEEELFI